MNRYLFKFSKLGMIRYTSHLDMNRLFQRAFKRAGIQLEYSKGFNPHPKLSFAHPLSLGYTSEGEYLEFETINAHDPIKILESANLTMPEGIVVSECWSLPTEGKTVASMVEFGAYELVIQSNWEDDTEPIIDAFLNQDQITILKKQKKDSKMVEIDIKPLIADFSLVNARSGEITLFAIIRAGSNANLNPELLVRAFEQFLGPNKSLVIVKIHRTDLFRSDSSNHSPISLSELA